MREVEGESKKMQQRAFSEEFCNKEKRLRKERNMREDNRKQERRRSGSTETIVQEPCYEGLRMHQESGRNNLETKEQEAGG